MSEVYQCKYSFMVYHEINKVSIIIIIIAPCDRFKVITLEVTTLGFVTKSIGQFRRLCRLLNLQDDCIITKCVEVALRATFWHIL
jgi:hypothetical protein